MLRHSAILLLLLVATTATAQRNSFVGVGSSYGHTNETIGIHARMLFHFNYLSIAPEITYFLPDVQKINGTTVSEGSTGYNLNLRYDFNLNTRWSAYPIIGANFTREFLVIDNPTSIFLQLKLNTGFGANLGIGTKYSAKNHLSAFAEYKYVTGTLGQYMPTIGILFNPQKKKTPAPIH